MASAVRLSDLPDDLLRRVLRFAPAREGAATAVLSRRWRTLWRTSGAVNLASRLHGHLESRDGFLRAAEAALAAAHAGGGSRVTRLTFHVDASNSYKIYMFLSRREGDGSERDMLAAVLSNPAARRVEELLVAATDDSRHDPCARATGPIGGRSYSLSFGALPSEALRWLHIVNCSHLTAPPPGAAFPHLAAVRLHGCKLHDLFATQRIVDAAPQLAALHLERCSFGYESGCDRLLGPAITALVFENCSWPRNKDILELDMPMLQYFRYEGDVNDLRRVSLRSPEATGLIRVDLHFTDAYTHRNNNGTRDFFWELVQNFRTTKALRVNLDFWMQHIAIIDNGDHDELLGNFLFCNLECLELQGCYAPESKDDAVAIANLLHCCPVVSDLRLKVTRSSHVVTMPSPFQHQLDLDKSIDNFRRRRSRAMFSLRGNGGDDYKDYEVSDIPCLSEHSFECLQSHLRRVSLQFRMDDENCFGVQLAKFFAENAMVLEEMLIADGSHKMCEHMNRKIGRWAANSSKRRNSPTTKYFRVLPLET
ncbi:hypothetical protein ACP70R_008518 [Stipagrostis hirtigluma subsp. patula]